MTDSTTPINQQRRAAVEWASRNWPNLTDEAKASIGDPARRHRRLTDDHRPETRIIDGADMAKMFAGVRPALSVGYTIADALAEQRERLRMRLCTSGLATGPDSADALIAEADRLASTGLGSAEDAVEAMISAYGQRFEQTDVRPFSVAFVPGPGLPGLSLGYRTLRPPREQARKRAPKPPKRGQCRRSRQVRSSRARAKRRVEQREALARPKRGRWAATCERIRAERDQWNTPRGAW